ncbi:MAG: DUF992 domain-containing protein [Rhizobiaceae bacterium]|nr:DUF992 domain-containing protein [Rhizobiaceae bacterium]
MRTITAILCSVFALGLTNAAPNPAHAQELIELGKLECFVDEGTGFILGSSKDISCVFTSNDTAWGEDNYFGAINRIGIDIGTTEEGFITWIVVAAALEEYKPGFLAGDYIGASASASFAVGLGANALVGGSGKSLALQPFSIETQKGLNFAAGIAELELRSIVAE